MDENTKEIAKGRAGTPKDTEYHYGSDRLLRRIIEAWEAAHSEKYDELIYAAFCDSGVMAEVYGQVEYNKSKAWDDD